MPALTDTAIAKLKRAAKALKKTDGLTHSAALDRVAKDAGFETWAQLMQLNHAADGFLRREYLGHPPLPL